MSYFLSSRNPCRVVSENYELSSKGPSSQETPAFSLKRGKDWFDCPAPVTLPKFNDDGTGQVSKPLHGKHAS